MVQLLGVITAAILSVYLVHAYQQSKFQLPTPNVHGSVFQDSNFDFQRNITRVAIIGAGVGGLISYRELKKAGYEVRLFERDSLPGGNWRYTEDAFPSTPYPSVPLEVADYAPSFLPDGTDYPYEETYSSEDGPITAGERIRDHNGPKPIWTSIVSNAASPVQQITELPWPVGTAWELPHAKLRAYLRAFASYQGVNSNDENPEVSYNTRVERVEKIADGEGTAENSGKWKLTLKTLKESKGKVTARWWTEDFDAVIVATGRYNAPSIPRIPGLEAWAAQWSDLIWHSRQYRRPEFFANKTVLIAGAATSGTEISRDLSPYARKIYASSKPEIDSFVPPAAANSSISQGGVKLVNGTVLSGIDHIIFSTGYRYTFPFLPQYHDSSLRANETAKGRQPIVTDGTHLRSLYLDLFYIEDPTLAFVNMNIAMQPFVFAEYLAVALAKVWKGDAHIPTQENMWKLYWDHVQERGGHIKGLQFLGEQRTEEIIRFFVRWLNTARGRTVELPPAIAKQVAYYYTIVRLGYTPPGGPPTNEFASHQMAAWGTGVGLPDQEKDWREDLSMFLDSW
ncbi:hypothetical protein BOTBODRAFT_30457 [Botryobasidium botryosum FD-172 SS1]|uniref:FAD/NAD(P)-binding domain-containing protein n=1 Tax=Botryobasidium botryosum (strain FD-172 SS1) TaxID=930990 RepID=A0A067MQT4_BOTB1|nr:hypothetical protein BOTBODRAFT_30457 [Botryobasidium botryosum FD-172 SS1]